MKLRTFVFIAMLAALILVIAACAPVQAPGAEAGGPCGEVQVTEVDGSYDLGGCELRVAVENAYQPFNFIDTDTGEAVGYDYDIFNEICTRINCTPDYIEMSWDAMVAVMGGEGSFDTFDVGADGITITEERAQNVDFSDPYIASQQMLLVNIDEDRFSSPDEFVADENLIIGTQLGTTNYIVAEELVGADRITAYDQFGTAVQALINGDVDAVMIDNVAGIGYVGVNADKIRLIENAVASEELGFIFGKGSQLTQAVNAALAEMEADGTLGTLFDKWFQTE
jgi:ABC-type amino acid transport substrate-binding protein